MSTIYQIAKSIPQGSRKGLSKKAVVPTFANGIKPEDFDARPGLRLLSPDQLATLEVPVLGRQNGGFEGFQREAIAAQARQIARAAERGEPLPVIEIAILPDGQAVLVDGQHRALGAMLAGVSLHAVIRKFSESEARSLFSNQSRGRRVNPNVTVLSADDPYSEYVQDAVTSEDHVWSPLVGMTATANRISPNQMFHAISNYSHSRMGHNRNPDPDKFDKKMCDELGFLMRVMGTKKSNPLAFRPPAIRALTDAAILAVRRQGSSKESIARWEKRMPSFGWADYLHLRRSGQLTDALLEHYSKGLHDKNKIRRLP